MYLAYFSPLSVAAWSVALAIVGYFFFISLNFNAVYDRDYKICYTGTGKLSRRLGVFERFFFHQAGGNNTGSIHTVLLLKSEVRLDQGHVKRALLMLLERFPLLRMRVTDRLNQLWFEEMENSQTLDFRSIEDVNADEWQCAFERQINSLPFNTERGPLWRIALLRETSDAEGMQILYKNTLLFSFHHIICDAPSIYELKKKLVEFLGLLYNSEPTEVTSLPFRPPIECFLHHLITLGIWERLLICANFTYHKLRVAFCNSQPTNLFLSTFRPPADSSVAEKTCIIPYNLTRDETLALIRCSKVNKCTIHGAITAATHLAMSQLLECSHKDLKLPCQIDSTYPVNIRKECQPRIEREEFGLYASFNSLQILINSPTLGSPQKFWEFARSCTTEVHRSIDSGHHRNFLKLFCCVDIPSFCNVSFHEKDHSLYKTLFNLNNLGSLSIDQEGNSPYMFAGSYFAVQSTKIRYVMGNNICTINYRLYWAVEYSPEITTKTQAEEFVDLSMRIPMDACSSKSTDSQ